MADYNLGTAEGRIKITYDPSGVTAAQKGMKGLTGTTQETEKALGRVSTVAGTASLALGAGLALATKKAADFEAGLSAIAAVSGATTDDMELLRKKALQLGADTAFSATEAASAMEELAKAGVSLPDILNGAADATVALAAAGGIALPEAATIAANAMNTFGLSAKDLAHVADLIAGAANASAIDVSEFGQSLQQAGAVANLVGLSFDDLAVAIALMGNAGIKGSDAGTSLKTMLSNLQPTTKKQIDLFRELGILTADNTNLFFDQQGHIKSLAEVSGILQKATSGMTDAQKQLTLETIFGSDAIRAAAILTDQGADGFNRMADAMGKVSAQDVAEKRLDNLNGSLEQLKGSAETAAIAVGTTLIPVIRAIADFITMLTNRFNSLDPTWQRLISFVLVAAAAILGLVAIFAKVAAAVVGFGAVVASLKVAAIIGAIVAVVAGLVFLFKQLWEHSETFRRIVTTAFENAKKILAAFLSGLKAFAAFFVSDILPHLRRFGQIIVQQVQPALKAISDFMRQHVQPAIEKLMEAFRKASPTLLMVAKLFAVGLGAAIVGLVVVLAKLIPILLKIAGPIFDLLIGAISFLIAHLPDVVNAIKSIIHFFGILGGAIGDFVDFWKRTWETAGGPVRSAFNLITSIIKTAFSIIQAIVSVAWLAIKTTIGIALAIIVPIVKTAFNIIRSIIEAVMKVIVPPVAFAFNFIRDLIRDVMDFIGPHVSKVWNAILAVIRFTVDAVIKTIDTIRTIVDKVRGFFNALKGAADGGTGSLIAFVKQIPGKILDALGNLAGLLFQKGRSLVQGLIDGIVSMFGALGNTMSNLAHKIAGWLPGSPAEVGPLSGRGWTRLRGQRMTQDLATGVAGETPTAEQAVAEVVAAMAAALPSDTASAVRSAISSIPATGPAIFNPPATPRTRGDINIQNLNLKGVWDFTDPSAARRIVADLHEELDRYEKAYR